jgi:hypothetical protein
MFKRRVLRIIFEHRKRKYQEGEENCIMRNP